MAPMSAGTDVLVFLFLSGAFMLVGAALIGAAVTIGALRPERTVVPTGVPSKRVEVPSDEWPAPRDLVPAER